MGCDKQSLSRADGPQRPDTTRADIGWSLQRTGFGPAESKRILGHIPECLSVAGWNAAWGDYCRYLAEQHLTPRDATGHLIDWLKKHRWEPRPGRPPHEGLPEGKERRRQAAPPRRNAFEALSTVDQAAVAMGERPPGIDEERFIAARRAYTQRQLS